MNSMLLDYSASMCKGLSTVKSVFGYVGECFDLDISGSILGLRTNTRTQDLIVTVEIVKVDVASWGATSVQGLFLIRVLWKILKPSSQRRVTSQKA